MPARLRPLVERSVQLANSPRGRRLGAWVAGIVAAIGIIGFLVVPLLVKDRLVAEIAKATHRPVTLEQLKFNPYTLSVTLRGFEMKERDGSATAVAFDELYVNVSTTSIFRGAPVLDAVRILKPRVRVVRNEDKSYNYQDLIDELMAKPAGPTPDFSLNNIEVIDGRIDFDDRPETETHAVTEIRVGIPFVSSMDYATDVKVQPELSAKVNGAPLKVNGETKPFKDTRETTLRVDLDDLHLPKYLDYSPVPLKFKLPSGAVDTRLALVFATRGNKPQTLTLAGDIALSKLVVQDASGGPVLDLPGLKVAIDRADLLGRKIALKSVEVQGFEAHLTRLGDGKLSVMSLLPALPATDAKTPAQPLELSIQSVQLAGGKLHLLDRSPAKPYKVVLQNITADIQQLSTAENARATVKAGFDTDAGGRFDYDGSAQLRPVAADGRVSLTGFRLGALYPYYESALNLEIADGSLDADSRFELALDAGGLDLRTSGGNATITKLRARFPGDKEPLIVAPRLALKDAALDLRKHTIAIGEVSGRDAAVWLRRDPDGKLHVARLFKAAADVAAAPAGEKASLWQWQAGQIALDNVTVSFEDLATATPVKLQATRVGIQAESFSNAKDSRAKVTVRGTVNKNGSFLVTGPVGINPGSANVRVEAKNVALVPLQPYVDERLNLAITSGAVSARGQLAFDLPPNAPPKASYAGNVSLTDFASIDTPTSSDLLKWKSLFVDGVKAQLDPLQANVESVALSDFYARIIVTADGALNLQQIVKKPAAPAAAGPAEAATPAAPATKAAHSSPATPDPAGVPVLPPNIRIGKITLQGGNVNFSDFFIKPNYSANLTGVGGTVTEMTAERPGDVELRARLDNTAPVEILGQVNPLGKDLFLDIKANARDIDLSPLTPYSVKYAGYGIERGKLSVNVAYKIQNRKLEAQNNIYLDQLTFGEKVDSPTATKLPVLLAVALLKDRNGVIDINLPISGSLDDPQFSMGGIIVRVIVNLVVKAVTAPFALLGAIFGGGEELAYIEFAAGSTALDAAADGKLKTLTKALTDRPGLKLDITGRVDPAADREGLKRASIDRKVRAQKMSELARAGKAPASINDVRVEPAEYPKYLTAAYKDESFPKPRNLIGLAKDLPVPEMEQLMLTHAQVTDEDLRRLANDRAQAVKGYLVDTAKVPAERVFVAAPKLTAEGIKDKGRPTRVDFALR